MRLRSFIALGLLLCSGAALADRQPGWDFGGELLYQFSQDISFDGGSNASLDDDIGIALTFGYRFSPRLELTFGLDWNNPLPTGEPALANDVTLTTELQLVRA